MCIYTGYGIFIYTGKICVSTLAKLYAYIMGKVCVVELPNVCIVLKKKERLAKLAKVCHYQERFLIVNILFSLLIL